MVRRGINNLSLWWKEEKKGKKKNLGEIQEFRKGDKTKPNTKKVYLSCHLNTSFEEENETVSIDEIMKFFSSPKSKAFIVHTLAYVCDNTCKNILNSLPKFLLKQ